MSAFKASVFIRGCETQHLYGDNREGLLKRAVAKLTENPPGFANTWPERVVLYRYFREISGKLNEWDVIEEVPFRKEGQ